MSNLGRSKEQPVSFGQVTALTMTLLAGLAGCGSASSSVSPTEQEYAERLLKPTNLTAEERRKVLSTLKCNLTQDASSNEKLPRGMTADQARALRDIKQAALEREQSKRTPPSSERICECIVDGLQDRTSLLQFELAIGQVNVPRLKRLAMANGMNEVEFDRQRSEALQQKAAVNSSCGRNFTR